MTWSPRASALAAALLSSTGLLVLPAAATTAPTTTTVTATAPDDGYVGYVGCGRKAATKPSRSCTEEQASAAFFLSRERHATYKVCVRYPGREQRLCASDLDAPRGQKQSVAIVTAGAGRHTVTWFVAGRKVATWSFRVTAA